MLITSQHSNTNAVEACTLVQAGLNMLLWLKWEIDVTGSASS